MLAIPSYHTLLSSLNHGRRHTGGPILPSIGCFSSPFNQPATDSLSLEAIRLHNNLTTQTTVLFGYPPPETPAWKTWLRHEWVLLGRRDEQFFWHTFSMSLHLPSTIYFISSFVSPCYSLWQYKSPRRTHVEANTNRPLCIRLGWTQARRRHHPQNSLPGRDTHCMGSHGCSDICRFYLLCLFATLLPSSIHHVTWSIHSVFVSNRQFHFRMSPTRDHMVVADLI
jgi:hypothetical protein